MLMSCKPRSAKLRRVIESFWCVRDAAIEGYETLLPSARAQVLVSLSQDPVAVARPQDGALGRDMLQVVQGPTTRPRRVPRRPQAALCGISFRPGGAAAIFGPLHTLTDQVTDLSHFWGKNASGFGNQLRRQPSQAAVLNLLQTEMEARVVDISNQIMLARIFGYMATEIALTEVAKKVGLSEHRFRRFFHANVGMLPKHFLRIERFRATISRLKPKTSLAEIAFEQAFSDQAHMTREVTRFASLTPRKLRDHHRPHVGHVPDTEP